MGELSLRNAKDAGIDVIRGNQFKLNPKDIFVDFKTNPRQNDESYGVGEAWDEWKKSILTKGVQENLRVVSRNGQFVLVHGFRRMKAVIELLKEGYELQYVPVIQVEDNPDTILELHLTLNTSKDFNVVEIAKILHDMMILSGKENYTALAERVNMDAQKVRNLIIFHKKASIKTKERVSNKETSFATAMKVALSYGADQNAVLDKASEKSEGRKIQTKHIGGSIALNDKKYNAFDRVQAICLDVITSEEPETAFKREEAKLFLQLLRDAKDTKISNETLINLFRNTENA